jgi:ABC-2 type transport system permease protein
VSALSLISHQARYDLRVFLRDPRARGFTVVIPILMLVLFGSIFKSANFSYDGFTISGTAYYVSRIIVMTVSGAALSNLVITLVNKRESGSLKRRHATPVPAWVLIAGDVITSALSALVIVVLLIVVGWMAYHVRLSAAGIGAVAVVVVLGTAVFCALAYALSPLLHSVESTGPAVTLVTLVLYAISGMYFPENLMPGWLRGIAQIFPFRPFALSVQAAVVPATNHGSHFAGMQLLELAAWGVAGVLFASWRFSWVPLADATSPRRSRRPAPAGL